MLSVIRSKVLAEAATVRTPIPKLAPCTLRRSFQSASPAPPRHLLARNVARPGSLEHQAAQDFDFGPTPNAQAHRTDMPPQPHPRGNDSHISSTQIRPVRFPLSFDAQNLLQQEASKLRATVKFQYFPECARLVREHLGAAQAVPFDWRQRQRQPLSSVKPDWSHGMQPPKTCLRQALGDEEAAFWVARGWVVVCLSRGLMLGDEEVKLALEHDSKVDSAVRDSLGSSDVAGSGPCIEVRVLALLK